MRTGIVCLGLVVFWFVSARLVDAAAGGGNSPVKDRGAAALIYDSSIPTIRFAASDVKKALQRVGYTVNEVSLAKLADAAAPVRVVITTVDAPAAKAFLATAAAAPEPAPVAQGFAIRKETSPTHATWWVLGGDPVGAMYGGFEVAETVQLARSLDALKRLDKSPYIAKRGIKFNIPLDARTPSYTDAGTSGQYNIAEVWSIDFWHDYLDTMARYRMNNLNIWSLHPFPSMVKVPAYPNVALSDVKKTTIQLRPGLNGSKMSTPESLASLATVKTMTIDQKIAFWKEVMQYAADRGIDFYVVTWNLWLYGTESSGYNFTNSLSDDKTADYFRKSVTQLVRTYPLLRGIGTTAGEGMKGSTAEREAWLFKTYGQGINDALALEPNRKFEFFNRFQMTNIPAINAAFGGLKCPLNYEDKYSVAHMFSTTKPMGIYADIDKVTGDHKIWLNCRDDDFFMFRWGDPEFMRAYITNMSLLPLSKVAGVYMGSSGLIWGRETSSKNPTTPRQLHIQKRWFTFMLFGRLAYDPEIPQQRFLDMLHDRFPEVPAQTLYEAWTKASQIIPLVTKLSYVGKESDWCWYPEACLSSNGFLTIQSFIDHPPQAGSGMIGIKQFAAGGGSGTTPFEVAQSIQDLADQVLALTPGMATVTNPELKETVGDIECLALLGRYYAHKIRGATNKALGKTPAAIGNLQEASRAWRAYAARVATLYTPQVLDRMLEPTKGGPTDITKLQAEVDQEITALGGTVPTP
jgi:hypothetical protein